MIKKVISLSILIIIYLTINVSASAQDTPNVNTLQNSVVTVWSNFGHSTGFIFDKEGLVMTNHHIIGPSDYIAVQFDKNLKVPAVLLTSDIEKDISILWVDLSILPKATVANLTKSSDYSLAANDSIMTITSSVDLWKTAAKGIISKIESKSIVSGLDKDACDSGCPFFNSSGEVIGIKTFVKTNGQIISNIMRIEETFDLIATAKSKINTVTKPSATLMPVSPNNNYPFDAAKEILLNKKFDSSPYFVNVDDFMVTLITPLLRYRAQIEIEQKTAKTKAKSNQEDTDVKNSFIEKFGNWADYAGKNKPILIIRAEPTFEFSQWELSMLKRNMALSKGLPVRANLRISTDFYRMRLMCGETEVQPIHPGKIFYLTNDENQFVNLSDANYVGLYFYPAESIKSDCGKLRLELFSVKEPNKPKVKVLNNTTFNVILRDFAPYLQNKNKVATQ